jgi:hypothetical protein
MTAANQVEQRAAGERRPLPTFINQELPNMKRTVMTIALTLCAAIAACGGSDATPTKQFPQNADIWTALGGDTGAPAAVSKVVDDAVSGLLADPKEAPYFSGVGTAGHDSVDRLKACLRLQFSAVLGGPFSYPGNVTADGKTQTCDDMVAAHSDLGIPGCVFDQFITDAAAVLKADGLSDAYIARVAPTLTGLKSSVVSASPKYLGPNTASNCQ